MTNFKTINHTFVIFSQCPDCFTIHKFAHNKCSICGSKLISRLPSEDLKNTFELQQKLICKLKDQLVKYWQKPETIRHILVELAILKPKELSDLKFYKMVADELESIIRTNRRIRHLILRLEEKLNK